MAKQSKYEKDRKRILETVKRLARDGANNEQIAKALGVAESTLYNWQNKHKELEEALRKNKEYFDYKVEDTALKKIFGYHVEEVEEKELGDGSVITTVKKKYIPPSDQLITFWLKNRMPHKWQDKTQTELSGGVTNVQKLEMLDDDELDKTLKNFGVDLDEDE